MKKNLIFFVVTVHLSLLLLDFRSKPSQNIPKKSIVVRTFTPPPQRSKAQPITQKRTPATQQRNPTTQQRKKVPANKKVPPQSLQKKELFKELKEALSKIEVAAPPESTLSVPKNISSLHIDTAEEESKKKYLSSLAQTLKEGLELPEHGEVRLELTIRKSGQVIKLNILHAVSENNRQYLETHLPHLFLPPFTEELKNEQQHTFTLTFCNEN